jgi:metal-responsive CopG/Arc/MetJ family transcriptional regulator
MHDKILIWRCIMSVVRLNITIPEELARLLDELVGPRKKSRFIAETVKQRIEKMQEEQLQQMLEEGYKARREESSAFAEEFEPIDMEGWDEY